MGNYNPDAPLILGEEWIGIRDEDVALSPASNFFEAGHQFTLATSKVLQDGRYYVNSIPAIGDRGQNIGINVYPAGTEGLSGPVRREVIPVNIAAVTGGSISPSTASGAAALLTPTSANGSIFFDADSAAVMGMRMSFAVGRYPQLNGKRILGVNLLCEVLGDPELTGNAVDPTLGGATAILMTNEFSFSPSTSILYGRLSNGGNDNQQSIVRYPLGEVNHFWTTTSPTATTDRMPWTYNSLLQFDTTTPWLFITLITGSGVNDGAPVGTSMFVYYAALEVFYCEEQRVAVGFTQLGNASTGGIGRQSVYGANIVNLRTLAYASNPVLAAGNYTVTVSSPSVGNLNDTLTNSSNYPAINAERQLYQLRTHPGVEIDLPFPLDLSAVGRTFDVETVDILPQLSLHTSGGPLTEVHAYGRQSVAQVYGTITATQEILDSAAGASFTYPWVRYYARRFGNTTVPLRLDSASATVSGSGIYAQITPVEFDALPEIVDGWKQVSLRFITAPSMGLGNTPTWRWSATGEAAGNRWEVLGCIAPALSGVAGNLYNLVAPSTQQLPTATYGQPSAGSTVNEGWIPGYAPPVTATTDDTSADAVLIFSQDMPAVSGFVVSVASQAVSGIGLECGLNPCAIPTALYYHRLTWTPAVDVAFDNFERTSVASWGNALSGQTWANQGGTAADHSVSGGFGFHSIPTTASPRRSVLGSFLNTTAQIEVTFPTVSTGVAAQSGLLLRNVDSSNHYEVDVLWNTNNTTSVRLVSRVAGTGTTLAEVVVGAYVAGSRYTIKGMVDGSVLYGKAWPTGTTEPAFWQATAVTTTFTAAGGVGVRSELPTGNTNTTPVVMAYDNFTNSPVTSWYWELQRSDTVNSGDWQTIMLANPAVSGFNDYEARAGIVSSYRLRMINSFGFYGAWSSVVTSTLTDPGLVVGSCASGGHLLMFSSNSRQNGSLNLGYASVWEDGDVVEGFTFPEAGWEQLQAMYGKDFVTAFRPLERGGDRFQRSVLVQAAAIAPETLADFVDLRNMAWADVPYICVRDEDGNRWFATVTVGSGKVTLYRKLYMAMVDIIETTATPTAVSP